MKDAKFKVSIAIVLIVCSSLASFIPLGNASAYKKNGDVIRVAARTIPIGRTIYGLSTPTKQYFKYVVRQEMYIWVEMWPTPEADYDLYGKWTPDTLPQSTLAGDPIDDTDFGRDPPGPGVREGAAATLEPGTYYIMIHNYSGTGTYDLGVYGISTKSHPPQTIGWFNDTHRGTAMYVRRFRQDWFVTSDKFFLIPEDKLGHQPRAYFRNNKILICYENDELKLTVFFHGTKKKTFCWARLNDKITGNNYLLVAFRKD